MTQENEPIYDTDLPTPEEIEYNEIRRGNLKGEARQIPLESIPTEERLLIEAYLNDTLHEEDIPRLNTVLTKYRPAMMKYEPEQTLKNLQENIQLVEDENYFLQLVEEASEIQVIPFTMYIGDKEIRMKFDLYPLTDSRAVEDVAENLSLFKDMTESEAQVYTKMQNGETLTREEQIIKLGLDQKIEKATHENRVQSAVEYLSIQLKFHGKDSSVDDMRRVFSRFSIVYLFLLFQEVQRRNHLSDLNVERVFQEFD